MKPYYEQDGIVIYHADCVEIMPLLRDYHPHLDVMITDPPYSAHTHNKQWIGAALTSEGKPRVNTAHKELGFDCLTPELQIKVAIAASELIKEWSMFFTDLEGIDAWKRELTDCDLDYVRTMIWDKVDAAPQFTGDRPAAGAEAIVLAHPKGKKRWNGGGSRNVLRHAVNGFNKGAKPHPSTKPLSLMLELVDLFTQPETWILDPFMGSGSTLVAALLRGRNAIGIEVQEKYCEVAAMRLENESRQQTLGFKAKQETMVFA